MNNKIMLFDDEYEFLSNMYKLSNPIYLGGIAYPSSENAYQAMKFDEIGLRKEIAKLTPHKSKTKARKYLERNGWHSIKEGVMLDVVRLKFKTNPDIAKKLIDTGNAELIEGNYWHDNYWGRCGCKDCRDKDKMNKLGKILMQVRGELNEKMSSM